MISEFLNGEKMLNLKSWEKQPGESDKSWSGFVVYRDLPPSERTIQAVAEKIQKNSVACSSLECGK